MEKELGINPYKFGMIGSTDTHTSLSTADEDNFFGKASVSEPNATRAAIFDAMGSNSGDGLLIYRSVL